MLHVFKSVIDKSTCLKGAGARGQCCTAESLWKKTAQWMRPKLRLAVFMWRYLDCVVYLEELMSPFLMGDTEVKEKDSSELLGRLATH